jgi:hypothetical protein
VKWQNSSIGLLNDHLNFTTKTKRLRLEMGNEGVKEAAQWLGKNIIAVTIIGVLLVAMFLAYLATTNLAWSKTERNGYFIDPTNGQCYHQVPGGVRPCAFVPPSAQ